VHYEASDQGTEDRMRAKGTQTGMLLIVSVFLAWSAAHEFGTSGDPLERRVADNPSLFEVQQQCQEVTAFFQVDVATARKWVPPQYDLLIDAAGKAAGAVIFLHCPDYFMLTTPNSREFRKQKNIAPAGVVHLWFMLSGPSQVLPVPGAGNTAATQYAYAVADLITDPRSAPMFRRAGKNAVLIQGMSWVLQGSNVTAEATFCDGSKLTLNATTNLLSNPMRLGGHIWNYHVANWVDPAGDVVDAWRGQCADTGASRGDVDVGGDSAVNRTKVMFLANVIGAAASSKVNIHADANTIFHKYFGFTDVASARAQVIRPNNVVNNSSRGDLAWTTYPPYRVPAPPDLPVASHRISVLWGAGRRVGGYISPSW
jgi:hypothetical protein